MSACFSEGKVVSVFEMHDFFFLIKSRAFFGGGWMIFPSQLIHNGE